MEIVEDLDGELGLLERPGDGFVGLFRQFLGMEPVALHHGVEHGSRQNHCARHVDPEVGDVRKIGSIAHEVMKQRKAERLAAELAGPDARQRAIGFEELAVESGERATGIPARGHDRRSSSTVRGEPPL